MAHDIPLREALEAKAEQFGSSTRRFDPTRHRELDLPVALDDDRPVRSGRGHLVLVAAALVAALAAAAVVASQGGEGTKAVGPAAPQGAGADPSVADGTLAPGWVPDGFELWSFDWSSSTPKQLGTTQLFGRDGGTGHGAVHVWIQAASGQPVGEDVTTVRGVTADRLPAKEFPSTTTTLGWYEGDVAIDASYTGMSEAQAVAFLDGLTWRSGDRLAGFAPPTGDLRLLGEAPDGVTGAWTWASYDYYLDQPGTIAGGEGRYLSVGTASGRGSGDGEMTAEYLGAWFHGTPNADGMVETYDPDYGDLARHWRDGRSVVVSANRTAIDRATLIRVADGLAPVTGTGLVALRQAAEARVATLPLLASVPVDGGVVELRGKEQEVVDVCLTLDAEPQRCTTALGIGMAGSFLVGDTWYVAVVGDGPRVVPGEVRDDTDVPSLPGATGTAQGVTALVVAVPTDEDRVTVMNEASGMQFDRPPF
jgi:hypothetical protein